MLINLLISYYLSFFFFLYIASILWVTRNPPKIFIAANAIAKKPKILEVLKYYQNFLIKPAIIAPTIITDEIAFVTDIKGVCNDGSYTPNHIISNKYWKDKNT